MSGILRSFVKKIELVVSTAIVSNPVVHASALATASDAEPMTAQALSAPVLEPSTLVLVGVGLVGLAIYRARYRDQK